jgi:hypothetical protein
MFLKTLCLYLSTQVNTFLQESRIISVSHCRERLESAILANIGVIQDKVSQDKKEVRARTGLLFVVGL